MARKSTKKSVPKEEPIKDTPPTEESAVLSVDNTEPAGEVVDLTAKPENEVVELPAEAPVEAPVEAPKEESAGGIVIDITPTVGFEDTPATETVVPLSDLTELAELSEEIDDAKYQIERCNLIIWSGYDKAYGGNFERSRAEWCKYILDLQEGKKAERPDVEEF